MMAVHVWFDAASDVAGLYCETSGTALECPLFRRDDVTGETPEAVADAFLSWHAEHFPFYDVRCYAPRALRDRVHEFHARRLALSIVGTERGIRPDPAHLRNGGGG
jgi:hypothetical protein